MTRENKADKEMDKEMDRKTNQIDNEMNNERNRQKDNADRQRDGQDMASTHCQHRHAQSHGNYSQANSAEKPAQFVRSD